MKIKELASLLTAASVLLSKNYFKGSGVRASFLSGGNCFSMEELSNMGNLQLYTEVAKPDVGLLPQEEAGLLDNWIQFLLATLVFKNVRSKNEEECRAWQPSDF